MFCENFENFLKKFRKILILFRKFVLRKISGILGRNIDKFGNLSKSITFFFSNIEVYKKILKNMGYISGIYWHYSENFL